MPQLAQVIDVGQQFRLGRGFGDGANDESAGLVQRQHPLQHVAQVQPVGLVFDALRNAYVRVLR